MSSFERTKSFYIQDFARTLFPLDTNRILIESAAKEIGDYVYGRITHAKKSEESFLPQKKVYASKPNHHLRRTVKLDPVAEFFLYDLIYRNRSAFRGQKSKNRISFGYRFEDGGPTSSLRAYRAFKSKVHESLEKYEYCAKFDISCYFNSIYHHDLVSWFNDVASREEDAALFDKFLKQTNSGRSVDCLVHGLYPAKMIGSHFLSFVEQESGLMSDLLIRFMDDFYVFSDDFDSVLSDFTKLQKMLGARGLSVNPSKTNIGKSQDLNIEKELDEVKPELLGRRIILISGSGSDVEEIEDESEVLNNDEIEYLMRLLRSPNIEEEDAELVLTLMRDYGEDVLSYLPTFFERFPNLSKNIYYFCQYVLDKAALGEVLLKFIKGRKTLTEYQLFWLAKIWQSYLLDSRSAGELMSMLYEHQFATDITKAKILEVADQRFGRRDLLDEHLRIGSSGWLAWASAVGSRIEKKKNRNHILSYFANGGAVNRLISGCVQAL